MADISDKNVNVYPKITFMKYFWQLITKNKQWVFGSGLVVALIVWAVSFIQVYTTSTIFRFQVSDTSSSSMSPSVQLEGILGKAGSLMDKNFNYVNSIPFYLELGNRFKEHPEGKKILPVFNRSRSKYLLKIKSLFFDTFTYDVKADERLQLAQSLQKVFSFKKEGDSSLIMYVRTGKPELSMQLGQIVGPMVKEIILENESYDLQVSSGHLKELLQKSQENLLRLDNELLKHKNREQNNEGSDNAPVATMEMEKELRLARIEVQRFDLLIKGLEQQIKENSTYAIDDGRYKYVDQISIERLAELKNQRETAAAKAVSVQRTYEKLKQENKNHPATEQLYMNLKWQLELEHSIIKDLMIKSRDTDGLQKLLNNSVRMIGETSLVPAKFRISRYLRFVIGFLFGAFAAILGIYYYFDFFKVMRGNHDLREFGSNEILNSIPLLEGTSQHYDIWKDLPGNHHATEAFRHIMERSLSARIVTFLSAEKGEGKSFLISNLAENLSRFGKKVVVVDTNWANPTLSKVFAASTKVKVISADQFKHGKDAFLDRSLLIREIKKYTQDADVVLIDTQNLRETNDALVAASVSNTSIVVASYLETYQHKFYNVIKKLEAAEIGNYCFILNKANISNEILSFKGQIRAKDDVDKNTEYFKKSS